MFNPPKRIRPGVSGVAAIFTAMQAAFSEKLPPDAALGLAAPARDFLLVTVVSFHGASRPPPTMGEQIAVGVVGVSAGAAMGTVLNVCGRCRWEGTRNGFPLLQAVEDELPAAEVVTPAPLKRLLEEEEEEEDGDAPDGTTTAALDAVEPELTPAPLVPKSRIGAKAGTLRLEASCAAKEPPAGVVAVQPLCWCAACGCSTSSCTRGCCSWVFWRTGCRSCSLLSRRPASARCAEDRIVEAEEVAPEPLVAPRQLLDDDAEEDDDRSGSPTQ